MADRRERMVERQRAYARSLRARPLDLPGKLLIKAGLVMCGVGLAAAVGSSLMFMDTNRVGMVTLGPILLGFVLMALGLGRLQHERRLDKRHAPVSEQQPWLFAPAPFAPRDDGVREFAGPGWQPDPLNPGADRWWDGQNWTVDTRARG